MRHPICSLLLAGMAAWALGAAWAQSTPAAQTQAEPKTAPQAKVEKKRPDRAIQRIRTEDAGSRIDELRVGGETQSITVQPKASNMPAYEVKPAESAKGHAPSSTSGDTNGQRVWNVLKF